MNRRLALAVLVPSILVAGMGLGASAASTQEATGIDPKTTDVCLLVWNGPSAPGRDGYCVNLPNLPRG
jgi:hypothetical protein